MRYLKSGVMSEESIHKAIIKFVDMHPKIEEFTVIHSPNEGKRTNRYGRTLKEMGMRPGVADLQILEARHGYIGAFIEVKTKIGKVSPKQKEFLEFAERKGYFTKVTWTLDEAIEVIRWYLCLDENHNN